MRTPFWYSSQILLPIRKCEKHECSASSLVYLRVHVHSIHSESTLLMLLRMRWMKRKQRKRTANNKSRLMCSHQLQLHFIRYFSVMIFPWVVVVLLQLHANKFYVKCHLKWAFDSNDACMCNEPSKDAVIPSPVSCAWASLIPHSIRFEFCWIMQLNASGRCDFFHK